ncbi:MAG: DUF3540 domain-containing protein [Planctomycetes bacterium]|nr:DUF3540 domain-containing protein [Planctomycetota bacterium]
MLTHSLCFKAQIADLDELRISISGETFNAQYALSAPVALDIGDDVLCLQDGQDQYYVIAPVGRRNTWRLQAENIALEAHNLSLKGDRLELTARRLFEKSIDAYRWTSNLLQWCCGRQRTLIDGQQQVRAGRIDIHAKGNVRIDGEQINLG